MSCSISNPYFTVTFEICEFDNLPASQLLFQLLNKNCL